MLSKLSFFFILVIAAFIGFHRCLQNGVFLRFLDEHPNDQVVPPVEYYMGQGYYVFQNLQEAATYFMRVPEHYPKSPYADDAYFAAIQTLDDTSGVSRATLIDQYQKYLAHFPQGKHAATAQSRVDSYKTGSF